ncbi:hypothetical protein COL26b_006617 [Colletotrichum chrysophilum]|uniref:uncharacterized protein n=1 Tax=Colletotrichum chrysophilum TaxID=1836956 RepID=UPI002300DBFB|nr:uncharacterized protein COL26b_006617 [Colletotrichum chrysophilum]KAJ0375070.1 hypothetical protein COL26b_006617 [Colletotrichum chrysophilum]
MAPQDHPPQHQQQPYTPSSASTIYASPASEHGRLPPPPTTSATTPNGALHPGGTPLSSSTVAAHPSSQSYPYNGIVKTEDSVDGNSASPDGQLNASDEPPKKKQKRNKPTLSCHECVERKTKQAELHSLRLLPLPSPALGASWSTVALAAAPTLARSLDPAVCQHVCCYLQEAGAERVMSLARGMHAARTLLAPQIPETSF